MSLRRKSLLILGGTSLLIFALLVLLLARVVSQGFDRVEDHSVTLNIRRAQQAIYRETERITQVNFEYSSWDETYRLMQGATSLEEYLKQSGLAQLNTYTASDIELVLILDIAGQPVLKRTVATVVEEGDVDIAFVADEIRSISEELLSYISVHEHLLQGQVEFDTEGVNGLVLLPETSLIISSRPILTSQDEGPSQGTYITAVRLDERRLAMFSEDTQVDIELQRIVEPLPAPFEQAYQRILDRTVSGETPIDIEPVHMVDGCGNENATECVSGYSVLRDVNDDPALLMGVTMPRAEVQQGRRTMWFFVAALIGVGVFFTLLALSVLDRLVLVPVKNLSQGVAQIGKRGSLEARLTVTGSDELTSLASTINRMLQDLADSLQREKELQIQIHELHVEIDRARQYKQVKEITDSEFFTNLKAKAELMRRRRQGD